MNAVNWVAIGTILTAMIVTVRVGRSAIKAIWNLTRTWQTVVPGFENLTTEVREIKGLLQKGEEWMQRQDGLTHDTIQRMGVVEESITELQLKMATLEGAQR